MMSDRTNLAARANGPSRRQAIAGVAMVFGGLVLASGKSWAGAEDEISHSAESIHQEPVFKASRKRVYDALTETKQFDKIIELSGVMKSAFAIFGGYITGRQIELVPGVRIIQAWRVGNWAPGVYSIAKFELIEHGTGTKIVFDQAGFPKGDGEHLASGWKAHYWEPLGEFLA